MAVTASEIAELREAYREARARIETLEPVERQIGLAAVRLEATHVYRQLVTTAQGLRDEDVAPLKHYVENLAGGEGAERTLGWLDAQAQALAKKALASLSALLTTGVLVGLFATVAGIVTTVAGSAEQVGASLTAAILGGGSVAVGALRGIYYGGKAGSEAWVKSSAWAASVGTASDSAMAKARGIEQRLVAAATGAPWRYQPFTDKARGRAQVLVGAAWLLVGLGAVLIAIGAYEALSAASDPNPPSLPPPPDPFGQ